MTNPTADDAPTPLDIEAIKARCEAATEGPWVPLEFNVQWYIRPGRTEDDYWVAYVKREIRGKVLPQAEPDARFIAHARQDIPALLARIAELEAGLAPFADMGSERLLAVALVLEYAQEYARATQGFKQDAKAVVAFLRKQAALLAASPEKE